MIVNVEFDWGYRSMTGSYGGTKRFDMNVDDTESHDEVVSRAEERARREVCKSGCFQPMLVTIRRLELDGGRFARA